MSGCRLHVKREATAIGQITGVVDEDATTISVKSVTRLSEVVQMCALPAKKPKK